MITKKPIIFIIPETVWITWQTQDFLSLFLETHSWLYHNHSRTGCTSERTIIFTVLFFFLFFLDINVALAFKFYLFQLEIRKQVIWSIPLNASFLFLFVFFFVYKNISKAVISISCYRLNIFKPPLNKVVNQTSFVVSTICTDRLLK